MKKRLIALVLILVMVLTFGLVACGPKPEEIEEIVDTTVQSIVDEALLRVLEEALTPEDLDALKTAIQAGQITEAQVKTIVEAAFTKFTKDQADAATAARVQATIRELVNEQVWLANARLNLKTTPRFGEKLVYAEVGSDKHSYLPYAEIEIGIGGGITSLEIGELFFPAGNAWTDDFNAGNPAIAYNNPWHPGFAAVKTAADAAKTLEAKKTAVDGKLAITIAGVRFVSQWMNEEFNCDYADPARARANVTAGQYIRFVADETKAGFTKGQVLTDQYLATNIAWYLAAVRATEAPTGADDAAKKAYIDASGVRVLKWVAATTEPAVAAHWEVDYTATFQDGALNKINEASKYRQSASGNLEGKPFKAGMTALATYLKTTEFQYAIEQTSSNNYENVNFKAGTIEWGVKYNNGTALETKATFQYAASYADIAREAYRRALVECSTNALAGPSTGTFTITTTGPVLNTGRGIQPIEVTVVVNWATRKIVSVAFADAVNGGNNYASGGDSYATAFNLVKATVIAAYAGLDINGILTMNLVGSTGNSVTAADKLACALAGVPVFNGSSAPTSSSTPWNGVGAAATTNNNVSLSLVNLAAAVQAAIVAQALGGGTAVTA